MCDILPQRRFSLAPADHGSSFEKKRDEILQRPIKASQSPKPIKDDDIQLEDISKEGRTSMDWNAEFQSAVDDVNSLTMNHSYEKRIAAYSKLGKLYQNFIDTATLYGKILISERYLPEECRTFKSCDIGGIAGGEKFLVQNILFKICTDHYGVFGGDEYYAHKLASHELKGLINIYNYGSKLGLYVPMMCVLMYKGFHMIAMSVLPINNSTLVYGSKDAGDTVFDNPTFSSKLKQVAEELGLKLHKAGKDPNAKYLYTPVDMEGHIGTDGRMYLLDFSRLFPPERPLPSAPRFMYLCRLLRPEFVKIYSENFGPLSSDAYSRFSSGAEADERARIEINAATDYLLREHLPLFLERFQRYHAIDHFAWLGLLHSHGISYRHMGSLRKLVLRLPPTPNYTNLDTATLILMAMIARVVKNQLSCIMRAQVKSHSQSIPGDQMLKQVAAAFFNMVFGNSKGTQNFWDTTLKYKLSEYFPNSLTDAELRAPDFGTNIMKTDLVCLLFIYTVKLCGLRLRTSAIEQFKVKQSFDFAEPLDESDIEEIKERVQSMSVAAFAEGYSMQMKAMHSANQHEAKRLYRLSLDKFKTALDMEPGNIQALTQIFVNMVQTDHPKVAESIYHSVVYGKLYDSEFLWRYANFCKSRGLAERAEVHYLYSLDLDPNYALCLSDYAKFLAEAGELHPANRFFQRAIQAAPTTVNILIDFAMFLYRSLKDPTRAGQFFEKAMNSPDFNSSYYPLIRGCAQYFPEFVYSHKLHDLFPATPDISNNDSIRSSMMFSMKTTVISSSLSSKQLDMQLSYVDPMEG
jgi:tetratricopeptide (TPR) repeat protein